MSLLKKGLLEPIVMRGRKTMIWKEKKRSSLRVVQMDDLSVQLGIRAMGRMRNVVVRDL